VPVNDSLCSSAGVVIPLIPTLMVVYRCWETDVPPRSRSAEKPFMLRITCGAG
jgi:hypothetical protein